MPPHFEEEEAAKETIKDVKTILEFYDSDKNGKLDPEEIASINADLQKLKKQGYNFSAAETKQIEALKVIQEKYDADGSGELDEKELALLHHDVHTTDYAIRYAGYLGAMARSARYFRVLFKPIVSAYLIKGSYALAFSYISIDLGFEYYSSQRKHPDATYGELGYMVLKRGGFQLTASIIMPMYTLQGVSKIAKIAFDRVYEKRHTMRAHQIQKYGPSLAALATVPFLPLIWDRPVSFVFDKLFGDPFKRLRKPPSQRKEGEK